MHMSHCPFFSLSLIIYNSFLMNISTSNQPQDSCIDILHDKDSSDQEPISPSEASDHYRGYKYALQNYFPHYTYQPTGTVQTEERPSWFHCVAYGIQHVLAMFSGVVVLRNDHNSTST